MTPPDEKKQSRADVKDVLSEFSKKTAMLEDLCERTKDLVEISLKHAGIRYQSVQARVKEPKSLEDKYLDPEKDYRSLDEITDQAGLRIITYYEDDVDRVAKVIASEFLLDQENCVDKREVEPDRFGYRAINYVCSHATKRTDDVIFRPFAGVKFEIQITSILSHAWSEMEHDWYDLKDSYPKEIKRRFSRLIALIELAEAEFIDIRKFRTQVQKSLELRVEANILDLPVDTLSMRSLIEKDPLMVEADQRIAAALEGAYDSSVNPLYINSRAKEATAGGAQTLADVRQLLGQNLDMVEDFVRLARKELWGHFAEGRTVPRGIAIYHLFLFLEASKGKDALMKYFEATGMKKSRDGGYENALVTLAQTVLNANRH